MAKAARNAKAKVATPPPRRRAGGGGLIQRTVALLALAAAAPFLIPTVLLLFFAMLPTMAAAIVDRSANRLAWLCVGGLNFAGVAPSLFRLWFGGHTTGHAIELLTDPITMMVAFACSGIGWALYTLAPPIVAVYMQMKAQRRVAALRAAQRKLVEQWGPGAASRD